MTLLAWSNSQPLPSHVILPAILISIWPPYSTHSLMVFSWSPAHSKFLQPIVSLSGPTRDPLTGIRSPALSLLTYYRLFNSLSTNHRWRRTIFTQKCDRRCFNNCNNATSRLQPDLLGTETSIWMHSTQNHLPTLWHPLITLFLSLKIYIMPMSWL